MRIHACISVRPPKKASQNQLLKGAFHSAQQVALPTRRGITEELCDFAGAGQGDVLGHLAIAQLEARLDQTALTGDIGFGCIHEVSL